MTIGARWISSSALFKLVGGRYCDDYRSLRGVKKSPTHRWGAGFL